MPTFLYRCPNTTMAVQGWVADDPTRRTSDSYEAVTCTACTRVHMVNPKTGKVMGQRDKEIARQGTGRIRDESEHF
jgi:hypothetical protein